MISTKQLEDERQRLKLEIKKRTKAISRYPKGCLQCHRNGNYYDWYIKQVEVDEDGNPYSRISYLKKEESRLAEQLARKGFLEREIADYKKELSGVEMYLRHHSNFDGAEKYINKSDELRRLTQPLWKKDWPLEAQAWIDSKPIDPDYYPEGRKYRCKNNLWVRSKSEQLIVAALEEHSVPYVYESPLFIGNQCVHPDFVILSKRNGNEYLWEHFGMMSDPGYLRDHRKKYLDYLKAGYVPFDNLLMTYESSDTGIDSFWIEKIIEGYLI